MPRAGTLHVVGLELVLLTRIAQGPRGVYPWPIFAFVYLRDWLIYRFVVFHMEGHVGLHHENSWHVTPQTENLNHEEVVRCEQVDDETARWLESPTSGRSPASG